MAGTATCTPSYFFVGDNERINVYTWACTTDNGTVSGTGSRSYIYGEVVGFETIPSSDAAPTANYDVYIYDENEFDILMGEGVDRSATVKEYSSPRSTTNITNEGAPIYLSNATLTPRILNAGDEKQTTLKLYIKNWGKK